MNKNSLTHKSEFEKLLANYAPNDEFMSLLPNVKLALLVAPAATGRNTIIRELVNLGSYHYLVSDTTRHIRINDGRPEQNGVEYWFKSENDALEDLRAGHYLGPAIIHEQQFSGIGIGEFEQAVKDHKTAITDIEIQGAVEISEFKNDSLNVFVLPPSYDEWMRRLNSRGEMELAEKKRRLESAAREIAGVLLTNDFALFINDELSASVANINKYISTGYYGFDEEAMKVHAKNLLDELKGEPFWHS